MIAAQPDMAIIQDALDALGLDIEASRIPFQHGGGGSGTDPELFAARAKVMVYLREQRKMTVFEVSIVVNAWAHSTVVRYCNIASHFGFTTQEQAHDEG